MNYVLLLGAGFSRNWGGWLANETFEYLLGCPEITPPLKELLFNHKNRGGFESAFAELQDGSNRRARSSPSLLINFQGAVRRMFADMDVAFADTPFEFSNAIEYSVAKFLTRFDAIYTLNQDLLLERHYLNDNVSLLSNGRWDGWCIPGMVHQGPVEDPLHNPNLDFLVPTDPSEFGVHKRTQPYFKLHGSSNWHSSADQDVMVIGGKKQASIDAHPILKFNYERFWNSLHGDTRLMVIGYSFSDDHINRALRSAATEAGLTLFVVDPSGIDVMDENRGATVYTPGAVAKDLWPHVIGASRRVLSSTFGNDRVEHGKLIKFFE